MNRCLLLAFFCLNGLLSLRADEIHSNGLGGGKWSSTETWEEKKLPGAEDTVVIASGDTVVFDRDDSAVISCAALSLDPESQFEFETTSGKKILRVNGPVEAYGHIRLDGSQSADSQQEIQLVGDQARSVTLSKGGGLIMAGFPNLPENRKNVAVRSVAAADNTQPPVPATMDAGTGTTVEIKNALLENLTITCTGINNTGLKPNERLNLNDSRFAGTQLVLNSCDTPRIAGSVFIAPPTPQRAAIALTSTPMAEVKGNQISGYPIGISVYPSDATITDNIIEKCDTGILYNANQNVMIQGGGVTDCKVGINLTASTGVIEQMKIVNCPVGIYAYALQGRPGFQANNVTFTVPAGDNKWAVSILSSSGNLLNCNVQANQVKTEGPYTGDPVPVVTASQYVVAKVNGTLPPNAAVRLQTEDTKIKQGAADPNVRNSPAAVRADGLSATPLSLGALIAKTWSIDRDGKVTPASPYKLSLVIPAGPNGEVKEIKSITIKPEDSWYRPDLNSEKPTVELSL